MGRSAWFAARFPALSRVTHNCITHSQPNLKEITVWPKSVLISISSAIPKRRFNSTNPYSTLSSSAQSCVSATAPDARPFRVTWTNTGNGRVAHGETGMQNFICLNLRLFRSPTMNLRGQPSFVTADRTRFHSARQVSGSRSRNRRGACLSLWVQTRFSIRPLASRGTP
jgi:hypothetical protein